MQLKLEVFRYATSTALTIEYYYITLCPVSRKLCAIVLLCANYEYKKMPMGLYNSHDMFQEKMNELFNALEYVRFYIDNLLIIGDSNFEDHINKHKII